MRGIKFITHNLEEVLGCAMLVVMVVVVFAGVVFRYVLNDSLAWPEEMARILFGWITFLGASAVMKRRGHLGVDTLLIALPLGPRFVLLRLVDVLVLSLLAALLVFGIRLVQFDIFLRTATMSWSWALIYSMVPFTAALMIVHTVRNMITDFRARTAERLEARTC